MELAGGRSYGAPAALPAPAWPSLPQVQTQVLSLGFGEDRMLQASLERDKCLCHEKINK